MNGSVSANGLDRKAHPYALADATRVSKRGFELSLEVVIVLSVTPPVGDVTGECGVLGESGAKASNKGREDARRAPAYSRWTPTPSRYVSAPSRAILFGEVPEHLWPFLFGIAGGYAGRVSRRPLGSGTGFRRARAGCQEGV